MSELLTTNRKNLKKVFANQIEGVTPDPVPLAVLEETRERAITQINAENRHRKLKPAATARGASGVRSVAVHFPTLRHSA